MSLAFISYSRTDIDFAQQLTQNLSELGCDTWIDVVNIPAGVKWSTAIQQGLDSCDALVLVVSPASMASSNVEDEWQYFLDHKKKVIPVIYQPAKVHFQLNRLQHIDFYVQDYNAAMQTLAQTLGIDSEDLATNQYRTMVRNDYNLWEQLEKVNGQLLSFEKLKLLIGSVGCKQLTLKEIGYVLQSTAFLKNHKEFVHLFEDTSNWFKSLSQSEISEVIAFGLVSKSSQIRYNLVQLISDYQWNEQSNLLIDHLNFEDDKDTVKAILSALYYFDIVLPHDIAASVYESNSDWVIKTFALHSHTPDNTVLFISDFTDYAKQLEAIMRDTGYTIVHVEPRALPFLNFEVKAHKLTGEFFGVYRMIFVIRGEHYGNLGYENFYTILRDYVTLGGQLFATPWLKWETQNDSILSEILPFNYTRYVEDVVLYCQHTEDPISKNLFDNDISYLASYEDGTAYPDSVVLLRAQNGIPVFGYRIVAKGICYYLNTCQHSCTFPQTSPFVSSPNLLSSIRRVINWIHTSGPIMTEYRAIK